MMILAIIITVASFGSTLYRYFSDALSRALFNLVWSTTGGKCYYIGTLVGGTAALLFVFYKEWYIAIIACNSISLMINLLNIHFNSKLK